jgi:hypothetical protein
VDASIWTRILDKPQMIGVMVPMVSILAFAIIILIKMLIRHRERMAMIERGLHPDYPPDELEADQNPPSKI